MSRRLYHPPVHNVVTSTQFPSSSSSFFLLTSILTEHMQEHWHPSQHRNQLFHQLWPFRLLVLRKLFQLQGQQLEVDNSTLKDSSCTVCVVGLVKIFFSYCLSYQRIIYLGGDWMCVRIEFLFDVLRDVCF